MNAKGFFSSSICLADLALFMGCLKLAPRSAFINTSMGYKNEGMMQSAGTANCSVEVKDTWNGTLLLLCKKRENTSEITLSFHV